MTKAWIGNFGEIGHPSEGAGIPSGIITMWSGSSDAIPNGWALCNGSNNTPDLRNRFIVGAGNSYTVGATGGEATHTLTVAEMPSHSHTFTGTAHNHSATLSLSGLSTSSAGSHTHNLIVSHDNDQHYMGKYPLCDDYSYDPQSTSGGVAAAGDHTHTITGSGTVTINNTTAGGTNSNTGSGSAHENRPPYYALCFIMKQ